MSLGCSVGEMRSLVSSIEDAMLLGCLVGEIRSLVSSTGDIMLLGCSVGDIRSFVVSGGFVSSIETEITSSCSVNGDTILGEFSPVFVS